MSESLNTAEPSRYAPTEDLQKRIKDLEKEARKREREIIRLRQAVEQEKIYANAKLNQTIARAQAQSERDRLLQLLLNNSPNIILFLDKSGRVAFCTNSFLKLIHADDISDVGGRLLEELLDPFCEQDTIDAMTKNMKDVMASDTSLSFNAETKNNDQNGPRKYIFSFTPMTNPVGENEGVMLLLHDVTDIEKAREDAERANVAKSQFLSNMSHEMRTPMNAIIGMAAIAKTSDDIDRKNYCLNKIDDASNHLLGVINDILDMSKIEADKFDLSLADFNFEKMLQKVVGVINFRVEEKHQNLTVNIDEKIPKNLIGDDQRLAQVITNLLSNAVKFTPPEGDIRLDAYFIKEKNGVFFVKIEVSDTGIGINPEQQSRLFSSFVQAESSTSRKFGGTGLGLAISKRIVEMMGGSIWIESELGKGSTFAFVIPAKRGDSEAAAENLSAEDEPSDKAENFEGYHLLLAEDVEINREIVLALLEPTHLAIDCAENGAEALRMFSSDPDRYDMIFMDVQMPEMDGYEATRRIRALNVSRAQTIPVIAMTANVFREDIENCLAVGMNDHVGKPLDFNDVLGKLRKYIKKLI